jgi:hypothetical protein
MNCTLYFLLPGQSGAGWVVGRVGIAGLQALGTGGALAARITTLPRGGLVLGSIGRLVCVKTRFTAQGRTTLCVLVHAHAAGTACCLTGVLEQDRERAQLVCGMHAGGCTGHACRVGS